MAHDQQHFSNTDEFVFSTHQRCLVAANSLRAVVFSVVVVMVVGRSKGGCSRSGGCSIGSLRSLLCL